MLLHNPTPLSCPAPTTTLLLQLGCQSSSSCCNNTFCGSDLSQHRFTPVWASPGGKNTSALRSGRGATARHHHPQPATAARRPSPWPQPAFLTLLRGRRENRGGGRALSSQAAPPPGQAGLSGSRRPLRFQREERAPAAAPVRPGRHGGGGGGAEAERRRCVRRPRGCYRRLRPLGFKAQLLPSPFFFPLSPPLGVTKPRLSYSRELELKTTLRELIVYIIFLFTLCLGKAAGEGGTAPGYEQLI